MKFPANIHQIFFEFVTISLKPDKTYITFLFRKLWQLFPGQPYHPNNLIFIGKVSKFLGEIYSNTHFSYQAQPYSRYKYTM